MRIYLTEQSAKISLSEEEILSIAEGKEVIGSPDTEFLSPFGKRIVIVVKESAKLKIGSMPIGRRRLGGTLNSK